MDNDNISSSKKTEVGDEPPEFSIGTIISMFRERGIVDTLDDEAYGPHTHLLLLLSIVFLIALIIGVVSLAM